MLSGVAAILTFPLPDIDMEEEEEQEEGNSENKEHEAMVE